MDTEGRRTRRWPPTLSARTIIVFWITATVGVALAVVVFAVRSVLYAGIAVNANTNIQDDLAEFRAYAAEERNATERQGWEIAQAFMVRKQPRSGQLLVATLPEDQALEVRGAGFPQNYALSGPSGLIAQAKAAPIGVAKERRGEIRWGRIVLENAGGKQTLLVTAEYTGPANGDAARTVRTLAGVALAALLITALISWLVSGQILRPVRLVRLAAADITERDLTRRIPVRGNDDVSDMARTFNDMLDRLENAFAVQQQFVDDAGHELRTPITIIRGHLELISDDPAERAATMVIVTNELDRMARIVTDLLSLAKAGRPDFVRPAAGVDVGVLTVELEAKVTALADRDWQIGQIADGSARLDEQRVTQAVLQLAQNAVQHTAPVTGRIELSSRFVTLAGERFCEFEVSDNGPGVPIEDRERIFRRFRHGTGQTTGLGGAGLGLAIVKAIAEAHGGTVLVGGSPGQGAIFTLRLPAGPEVAPSDEPAPATQNVGVR